MTNEVDFNALAQTFFDARGEKTYCDLFDAVFALPSWHFIATGEFPNLMPYCAVFPDFFDGQPMVTAFTDTERLEKYIAESNLHFGSADKPLTLDYSGTTIKASSENLTLSIPTTSVIDYLEQLTEKGVKGIFFNPDINSVGFHLGLPQLRQTKELVDSKKTKAETAKVSEKAPAGNQQSVAHPAAMETVFILINYGLLLPSGFYKAATHAANFYCIVPHNSGRKTEN